MAKDVCILAIIQKKTDSKEFRDQKLHEMSELARSAGGEIRGSVTAHIERPTPSTYIAKGKLLEIAECVKTARANLVIFSVDLTPVQSRNIESEVAARTVDRTGLILDIFARRAQSHAGRLQVELAQLNYLLPRLTGHGVIMSRLGGGIGTRGPGEQKLEVDRRKIRDRIVRLKGELEKLKIHQRLIRKNRRRKDFSLAAIIGYTNAGKSTLLNTLTGSEVLVEDKLFATLDPTTRALPGTDLGGILLTDTVGFLADLPHMLIEAFRATLEEVTEADLLIHVLDVSDANAEDHYRSVREVLGELGAVEKSILLALNKWDQVNEADRERVQARFPEGIPIIAKEKQSLAPLIQAIRECAEEVKELKKPYSND